MISVRNQGGKLDGIVNLANFEDFSINGREGGSPPRAGIIDFGAVVAAIGRLVLPDGPAYARDAMGVAGEEGHVLFRVEGMAMKGYTGAEGFSSARVPPEEVQTLGFH